MRALGVSRGQDWVGGGLFWLYQAYGQVLEGRAEVEEALDAAQRLAEQYRACIIAAGRFDRAAWQGCLKRTDPSLPDFIFSQSE